MLSVWYNFEFLCGGSSSYAMFIRLLVTMVTISKSTSGMLYVIHIHHVTDSIIGRTDVHVLSVVCSCPFDCSPLLSSHRDSLLLEAGFITIIVAPLNLKFWKKYQTNHNVMSLFLLSLSPSLSHQAHSKVT